MTFNEHSKLKGQHAFLGASKYHWLNYDETKLMQAYMNAQATQRGTELHEFACRCIELGINLPKTQKTLNLYVNDAIGYKMTPEQPLVHSLNCFGTADAICFRHKLLRIHDLKTGSLPRHIEQLLIYAALFYLEYGEKPENNRTELRIYQNDEVLVEEPDPQVIRDVMNKIIAADLTLDRIKTEA